MRASLIAALALAGCCACNPAEWRPAADQSLKYANSAAEALATTAEGLFRGKCMAIVQVCQARQDQQCPEAHQCLAAYRDFNMEVVRAFALIAQAKAALSTGDALEFKRLFEDATKAIEKIRRYLSELEKMIVSVPRDRRPRAAPKRKARQWTA